MFKSRRNQLEGQLKEAEERIEGLQLQIDSNAVPEPKNRLDELRGPEGRKASLKTDLWLAIQEAERLQLALDQIDKRRLAQLKALLGDSLQLAINLMLLRWLVGLSWTVSLVLGLLMTVAYSLLYQTVTVSRRTLELAVFNEARRVAKEEGISLLEARRRVEDLRWP